MKYADDPVALQRYENSASVLARAASPLSCARAYAPDVLFTVSRPLFVSVSTVPALVLVIHAVCHAVPSAAVHRSLNRLALTARVVTSTAGLSGPTLPAVSTARTV